MIELACVRAVMRRGSVSRNQDVSIANFMKVVGMTPSTLYTRFLEGVPTFQY